MSRDEAAYEEYARFCQDVQKIDPAPFVVWLNATRVLGETNYSWPTK